MKGFFLLGFDPKSYFLLHIEPQLLFLHTWQLVAGDKEYSSVIFVHKHLHIYVNTTNFYRPGKAIFAVIPPLPAAASLTVGAVGVSRSSAAEDRS